VALDGFYRQMTGPIQREYPGSVKLSTTSKQQQALDGNETNNGTTICLNAFGAYNLSFANERKSSCRDQNKIQIHLPTSPRIKCKSQIHPVMSSCYIYLGDD
jgi:hypothetical protein